MTHGRWRWEYRLDEGRRNGLGVPKRWRLFVEEAAEASEARSLQEVRDVLPSEHPALARCASIFGDTRDRVFLAPWRPFAPARELLAALGPDVVERMQAKPHEAKVWSSADGWVWLHMPGDAALQTARTSVTTDASAQAGRTPAG